MRFLGKAVRYLLLGIGIAMLTIAGLLWVAGLRSVPEKGGEAALPGLNAPVRVLFDARAIPTIRADNMTDAYRALGYLHARDRLWQMEAMRRIGAGRMSEVAGPPMVSYDRLMRELGLYRQAEAQETVLGEDERADLQAYADGVNAYLDTRSLPLPIEFQLTQHSPEPWTVADSLVWGRLMSVQLSGDAFFEARRAALIGLLGAEKAAEAMPPNDKTPATMSEENRGSWISGYDASNAWVLSGARTETGKPILANDPHLGLGMPGQWYLVRIETPGLTLVGATAPGVPLHVLGHNGRIAWGLTTTHADTQDSVILDQDSYNTAKLHEETISVRFGSDETLTVRQTAYGPVVTRLDPARPTAMTWAGSDTPQRTASALYRLNRARNWDAFLAAAALFDDPMQNLFYADTDGHIGMKVVGTLPRRAEGADGSVPTRAGRPEAAWAGTIPSADLPGLLDPESGVIWNANNRVIDDSYPHRISTDFEDPYRAQRLIDLLNARRGGHTLQDSAESQLDTLSMAAAVLVPHFLKAEPAGPLAVDALGELARWDRRMDRDRAGAAIYATMLNEFVRLVAEDDMGPAAFERFWRAHPRFAETVLTDATHWCDDIRTEPPEDCGWALSNALERAVFVLNDELGDEAAAWRWGDLHVAPMRHLLLNAIPGLGALGNRPLETPGGDDTLNRGQATSGEDAPPFAHVHGAGFRAVYDLDELDRSLFALAGGQSGNPFSPHYDDLLTDWRDGRYFGIPGRVGDIPEDGGALLILRP